MAGPIALALGPYRFAALGFALQDLSRQLQTPWAELDVAQRMDAAHWTGPKGQGVTIGGVLFPEEFGGMTQLAGIASAAKAGRPLMLVTGAGDVGGLYRVEGISEDWSHIDAAGRPRRDAFKLELKLYVPSAGAGLGALVSLIGNVAAPLVGGMVGAALGGGLAAPVTSALATAVHEASGLIVDAAVAAGVSAVDIARIAGEVGVQSFASGAEVP
jgi:phage protein U